MGAKVYFSKTITPEKVLELYRMAGKTLSGKVAVKVHSGESEPMSILWTKRVERLCCFF